MHTLAGLLLLFPALAAPPAGEKLELAPQTGVAILKNGHAIAGKITRAGDYLVVTQGAQSELRLPAADVDFVSANLEEAYARKAAALPANKVAPHLDLAEWCLRQDMPARATQQWLIALQLDPEHPRVNTLEQRLKLYAERATTAPAAAPRTASVSPDDLDKFTRELPKAGVEKFAATIQPILLNRCAMGGCHGPSATADFKLFRPAAGLVANRRFTQRNLYATLQHLDREMPERSPLLVKPQERHGGGGPVFDKQSQSQLDQLTAWVRQVVVEPQVAQPASIRHGPESLSQPGKATPEFSSDSPDSQPASAKPAKPGSRGEEEKPKSTGTRDFKARDPFDPEQFNRLHHSKPQSGQSAP